MLHSTHKQLSRGHFSTQTHARIGAVAQGAQHHVSVIEHAPIVGVGVLRTAWQMCKLYMSVLSPKKYCIAYNFNSN
jgi:hypothetical protein